ncbi:uncharacterized protein ALTATR162_LOCUS10091 [Alternaria atra]|uniref:Uncharacterized protein n=1 Tax=Alternaria atra TaxID=119953 RepID=A0A8J2IF61_9PLEO|nr:uncharacterized protein ALTATR162_LOCUS10091 [Alternaria atra]CAG5182297.1 unnamed protein product [Alternaria atra]
MEKLKEAETVAAQRLRKTFKYPSESDDEDTVEAGMDEQDRAALLQTLSTHDTSTTHTYTLFLLALPLLPTLLYIPHLFTLSTLPTSLIAIASLLATAYTLYFLPLPPTQMELIDGVDVTPSTLQKPLKGKGQGRKPVGGYGIYNKTPSWEQPTEKSVRRPVPYLSKEMADKIGDYIVPINRAVCGLLALYEVWLARDWSEGFMVGGGFLPGVICLVILWARTELRIIDMDVLEKMNTGAAQGKVK